MEDTYIVRDETRVIAISGHRSGEQRRQMGPAQKLTTYDQKILKNQRGRTERRHTVALSFKERLLERLSCLINGIVLLAVGIFFLLTGLTFLPIVGGIVGVYMIIESLTVMAKVLNKVA